MLEGGTRRAHARVGVGVLLAAVLTACGGKGGEADASASPGVGTSPSPSPAPAPSSLMPSIDTSKIPARTAGFSVDRVISITEQPGASDGTGAFRTVCDYSHMAADDPIVYPRQPGRAHMHTFFGNTDADAYSTATSILSGGNTTCRGGTVNRSSYWVPTMVDTRTGTPLRPNESNFYYKTGYVVEPGAIKAFPQGLRMIAGSASATAANDIAKFSCHMAADTSWKTSIPNCPAGTELWQNIRFPQCWDGVNLDSPDHKSHMAYPSGNACPSTHPVALPEITFNIVYPVAETNAPLHWRLSSDNYPATQPAGYSSHGDWFYGWKPVIVDTWVSECLVKAVDCHSHLLGDGRAIY